MTSQKKLGPTVLFVAYLLKKRLQANLIYKINYLHLIALFIHFYLELFKEQKLQSFFHPIFEDLKEKVLFVG